MARPSVSVVICCYSARRSGSLLASIAAVQLQLLPGDELVVVVDHDRELLELLNRELATGSDTHGRTRHMMSGAQRGLSGARNFGASAAHGDVLVFVDDDAAPRDGWLEHLMEPFADPAVIGVGGWVAPAFEVARPAWLPEEFLWVVGCSYRGLPGHGAQIRNPIGANMALRREAVRAVGGFTSGIGRVGLLPLGCEETELAIRATRATGGRVVIQRSAVVDHLVSAERLSFTYFVRRCWAEGISKALIARTVGSETALASERTYIAQTLSTGFWRGVLDAARGEPAGILRAAAILIGLAVTSAGYARGRAHRASGGGASGGGASGSGASGSGAVSAGAATRDGGHRSDPRRHFTPIWVGELDLSDPNLPARVTDKAGTPFARARLLVRIAGTPLGFLTLDLDDGTLDADLAAALARDTFAGQLQEAVRERTWSETPALPLPISVAICTAGRPEGVTRTLESLLAVEHRDLEIMVVDNGASDPATREMVARFAARDARVRYVEEPRTGLSRARNRAIAEARHEIIAFTDDDVTVDRLWPRGILRGFARDPAVACVTGLVVSASLAHPAEQYFDGRVWWSSSFAPRLFTAERLPSDPGVYPYSAGIFGTGANFACRTSVLRALGGFDQSLGAGSRTRGGEDLDMFVRLLSSGHLLSFEPSAIVWHHHRTDEDALRDQMYAYGSGLTAYLTKYLADRRTRRTLLQRGAAGCLHMLTLSRRARESEAAAGLAPGGLAAAELRGMLAGPIAYLRERSDRDRDHVSSVRPPAPAP